MDNKNPYDCQFSILNALTMAARNQPVRASTNGKAYEHQEEDNTGRKLPYEHLVNILQTFTQP